MLHKIAPVTITTDSGGAATVYIGSKIRGTLYALIYRPGTLETGADLTITTETNGLPILTKVNLGTGNSFLYPRAKPTIANDATGGLGSVPSVPVPLCGERIKVVVAQGGNALTGTIEAIYDDGRSV
jgi:hypothetical protein